jgi:hypothetical protein
LADVLNHDREVIRIWFCNRRQAMKSSAASFAAAASQRSFVAVGGRRPPQPTVRTITTSTVLTD